MNKFDAYTAPVTGGGYHAMLRLASDAEARPIHDKLGRPAVFEHEAEALKSMIFHLVRYINGHLVRDGEVAGATLEEADSHFSQVLRQKGKTRVISVSYKGRKVPCTKKKGS